MKKKQVRIYQDELYRVILYGRPASSDSTSLVITIYDRLFQHDKIFIRSLSEDFEP
jgi:hypothetical protein